MAEREVELSGSAAGELRLRLLGTACSGCSGGCAGRCNLFAADRDGEFILAAPDGFVASVGQRFRLQIDDDQLRRAAWRGYGVAWLGMMLGAGLGFALGTLWLGHVDLLTLVGLAAGTFLAVAFPKRHLPAPRLLAAGQQTSPNACTSDRQ